jgi:hypothetical protein
LPDINICSLSLDINIRNFLMRIQQGNKAKQFIWIEYVKFLWRVYKWIHIAESVIKLKSETGWHSKHNSEDCMMMKIMLAVAQAMERVNLSSFIIWTKTGIFMCWIALIDTIFLWSWILSRVFKNGQT